MIILTLSMLNEDTLETHIGVSMVSLFYGLIVFGQSHKELHKMAGSNRLSQSFFCRDVLTVAPDLLGKYIVIKNGNAINRFMITEVEAYRGEEDLACHASREEQKGQGFYIRKEGQSMFTLFMECIGCLILLRANRTIHRLYYSGALSLFQDPAGYRKS